MFLIGRVHVPEAAAPASAQPGEDIFIVALCRAEAFPFAFPASRHPGLNVAGVMGDIPAPFFAVKGMGCRAHSQVGLPQPIAGVVTRFFSGEAPVADFVMDKARFGQGVFQDLKLPGGLLVLWALCFAVEHHMGQGRARLHGERVGGKVVCPCRNQLLGMGNQLLISEPRRTVNQIGIERIKAGVPGIAETTPGLPRIMAAVHVAQILLPKRLDADRQAVHPQGLQHGQIIRAQIIGIGLQGNLQISRQAVVGPEGCQDSLQFPVIQQGRGTPTKVNGVDVPGSRFTGPAFDFPQQGVHQGRLQAHAGAEVKIAVVTSLAAEGDMEIDAGQKKCVFRKILKKSRNRPSHVFAVPHSTCLRQRTFARSMNKLQQEIATRRTFAIISHPDAGKTTLTEKLLLFGGAIQVAGAVKSNKIKKTTTSDFMEIEKQRGISVATSVMAFEYRDLKINILDTPGHKDFAEDTYRTLTAVDSVIVVIDVAKGVEEQTERLVEVCRMRQTPIIVFINKLDREGKDGFELLDEIEAKLQLRVTPLSWPAGMGQRFKGVYSRFEQNLVLFRPHSKQTEDVIAIRDLADPALETHIGAALASELREETEMIETVYPPFSREAYIEGRLCPVFFGSAVNNFGVRELLDCFVQIAPPPLPRQTEERLVRPEETAFSGFVFKIHANIDPRHRDRIAFLRICSGMFERNTPYHHVRQNRDMRFSNPTSFMASKKEIVDEAFPGDVIGLYDSGNFKIGDVLTSGEDLHFKGMPSFSPEIFRIVHNDDPLKSKQFSKGLDQLMDEGVAQLFTREMDGRKIIGVVGHLQLDVIQYRLEHEYGAKASYEPMQLHKACWVTSTDKAAMQAFLQRRGRDLARDKEGHLVFMAESAWMLKMAQDNHPEIDFHFTSEH